VRRKKPKADIAANSETTPFPYAYADFVPGVTGLFRRFSYKLTSKEEETFSVSKTQAQHDIEK
jgi:hypothetical protein